MAADDVEFSSDGRFRLLHGSDVVGGASRTWIRLEHAPTARIVLDLTDPACTVDSHAFSADGKLLYLRLSRMDRSVTGYPATLDLATGLYYHHPDPRQANGPAGHAEDLESIARTGRPPRERALGEPVRWPKPEELDWPQPPPPEVTSEPDAIALDDIPEQAAELAGGLPKDMLSPDRQYRAEFTEFEMRMSHWVRTCCIRHVPTCSITVDFTRTLYDVTVTFQPEPDMVKLRLHKYPGDTPPRTIMANLKDRTYRDLDDAGELQARSFPLAMLTRADD